MHLIYYCFIFFSILGWILEVGFRSVKNRRPVNPGFHKGFYLPVYGFGALFILYGNIILSDYSPAFKFLYYIIVISTLELIAGLLIGKIFDIRLWDYRTEKFNIHGYICLRFSICWGFLAIITDFSLNYFIPHILKLYYQIYSVADIIFILISYIMIIDSVTSVYIKIRENYYEKQKEQLYLQFNDIARPLLEHPDVIRLGHIDHHLNKTRLDHVTEVAWWSFVISKKFSLDCNATVRGALLHDLFYYDWRYEGPRLHGFRHPEIALENALKITLLSDKEADIIKKHMWPLTVIPPYYPESFIVSVIDTLCSTQDYLSFLKNLK